LIYQLNRGAIEQFSVNSPSDVSTAEILVPFLFNTICLMFFFWNAYQCDPGVIRTSREEKLQVLSFKNLTLWLDVNNSCINGLVCVFVVLCI